MQLVWTELAKTGHLGRITSACTLQEFLSNYLVAGRTCQYLNYREELFE